MSVHRFDNSSNLFHRFAGSKDDFGKALPQRAVVVDVCEAEVLEREGAQTVKRFVGGQGTTLMFFQNLSNLLLRHTKEETTGSARGTCASCASCGFVPLNILKSTPDNILTDAGVYREDHETRPGSPCAKCGTANTQDITFCRGHSRATDPAFEWFSAGLLWLR